MHKKKKKNAILMKLQKSKKGKKNPKSVANVLKKNLMTLCLANVTVPLLLS